MKTLITKLLAGPAVAVALAAVVPTAAGATPMSLAAGSAPSSTTAPKARAASTIASTSSANTAALAVVKAKAAAAISVRDSALGAAIAAVNANHSLTAADKATVLGTLNGDLSGLNALASTVQADPTLPLASADYTAIFLNFRVFALALPQARLAASADDLTGTVVPHLSDAESRLASLLSGAEAGKDTSAVKAAMADLAKQISSVTTDTSGVAAQVLAYHPGDWNANHAILDQPRASLLAARAAAVQARTDITTVVAALK